MKRLVILVSILTGLMVPPFAWGIQFTAHNVTFPTRPIVERKGFESSRPKGRKVKTSSRYSTTRHSRMGRSKQSCQVICSKGRAQARADSWESRFVLLTTCRRTKLFICDPPTGEPTIKYVAITASSTSPSPTTRGTGYGRNLLGNMRRTPTWHREIGFTAVSRSQVSRSGSI